jgi:hypothetical protein
VLYPLAKGLSAMPIRVCELCEVLELEFREKELSQGANQVHSSDKLKSKLPKFKEGDDPDVYLKSFERLLVLHKVHKREWASGKPAKDIFNIHFCKILNNKIQYYKYIFIKY